MTKKELIRYGKDYLHDLETACCSISDIHKEFVRESINALEQDNEEIFKQFKKKVFLESEDVLGNEMVDSYMITDYLAKLLGVEND